MKPLAAVFLLLAGPASAAEAASRPGGYAALLGGGGPVFGSLDAFTQQTQSSPRASDSRAWSGASAIAARTGVWGRQASPPWGAAVEASRVEMTAPGGSATAWTLGVMLLARPPESGSWRLFPYAGLGAGVYILDARTDYRPRTAAALKTMEIGEPPMTGPWTFDARLGVQGRASGRLFLLAEARLTRFAMDRDWTPATWFGPPSRYREGVSANAVPLLFMAGAGLDF